MGLLKHLCPVFPLHSHFLFLVSVMQSAEMCTGYPLHGCKGHFWSCNKMACALQFDFWSPQSVIFLVLMRGCFAVIELFFSWSFILERERKVVGTSLIGGKHHCNRNTTQMEKYLLFTSRPPGIVSAQPSGKDQDIFCSMSLLYNTVI